MKPRKIEAALTKKGFRKKEGSRHIRFFYHRLADGKEIEISTTLSRTHYSSQVEPMLISKMARQCGLTSMEFKKFVKCDIDQVNFEMLSTKMQLSD